MEEIQGGEQRAEYGKQVIKTLSKQLNDRYKKGFSLTNLKTMRLFYLPFNQLDKKGHTVCGQLSWSHFKHLIRVENGEIAGKLPDRTISNNIDLMMGDDLLLFHKTGYALFLHMILSAI